MPQLYKLSKYKTKVEHEQGWTLVKLFKTYVVAFNDEWIVLNTGGWRTQTTKNRMNQASNQFHLGYWVYQSGGNWIVNITGDGWNTLKKAVLFKNDMLYIKRK